jgi:D-alanyl-D-alanine dipeptidase
MTLRALVLVAWFGGAPVAWGAEQLVDVATVIPDVVVDLRYATTDNFMKRAVYPPSARCLLLARSVAALAKAAGLLRAKGFRLRLYDCYRPSHVQYELWKVMPIPGYVADPKVGSHHSRGGAVDVSLATRAGGEVEMPSPYDFFGTAAHHSFAKGSATSRANRDTLRAAMEAVGFTRNPMEWWHYDLPGAASLPLRDDPF